MADLGRDGLNVAVTSASIKNMTKSRETELVRKTSTKKKASVQVFKPQFNLPLQVVLTVNKLAFMFFIDAPQIIKKVRSCLKKMQLSKRFFTHASCYAKQKFTMHGHSLTIRLSVLYKDCNHQK